MTLPASGAISFNAINVELGQAGTTQASIGQSSYRTLAGVPSGQISLSDFYGKSNRVTINLVISSNTLNYNIFNNKGGTYVAGKSDIIVTVNSGVVVGATIASGNAGMDTGTGWTSGDTITIVNNGFIVGSGSYGGYEYGAGNPGGLALWLRFATSIQNNYVIGGGGGSGAGGTAPWGGLIGGSGAGFDTASGASVTNGGYGQYTCSAYGCTSSPPGGSPAVSGTSGTSICDDWACYTASGGGGGLGATGGANAWGYPGGAGGYATYNAGIYATWLATGYRYGAIN